MNPESLPSIILATSSAALLAPAIKKLTSAAAQGLSLLKRNQTPAHSDAINTSAVHQTLAEVDQLLIELQSTLQPHSTPPTAAQNPDTISQANQEMSEMVDSIHGLVDEVRQLAGPTTATADSAPSRTRQAVGEVLGSILAFGGSGHRARIFMSAGMRGLESSYIIKIAGNRGSQLIIFISGTTSDSIINAVNAFAEQTGVVAKLDKKTGYLIEMLSAKPGSGHFVAARRIERGTDDLLYDENRSHPSNLQVDFGEK